jgi:hypothetical protein
VARFAPILLRADVARSSDLIGFDEMRAGLSLFV